MSEQVENPPPAEIVPAKSEDKLEIEKEEEDNKVEKESDNKEQEEAKVDEPVEEEKSEMDEKQAEKSDESKEEDDKKDSEQKDENEPEEKAADEASDKKDTDEAAAGSDSKKKFKIPDVKLKTPKVPGFLRSKSKDRKKVRQPIRVVWLSGWDGMTEMNCRYKEQWPVAVSKDGLWIKILERFAAYYNK